MLNIFSYHLSKQGTTKINLAVDKLPDFHCCKSVDELQYTGTIHIGSERYVAILLHMFSGPCKENRYLEW